MADRGIPDPKREHQIDWAQTRTLLRARIEHQLGRGDGALDDLTQQASIELLRVVRRDGAMSLNGLIAVVARTTVVDEIRRRQRERDRNSRWQAELQRLERDPGPGLDHDSELLWFLLLQFLRTSDPHGHTLAVAYAELGGWGPVADSLGQNPDATRKQWSRSVHRFLRSLERDPGPFKEWLDGV